MTGTPSRNAYLLAILAVLFWSTSPTAFKIGLGVQDSYQLLTGASIASLLVLGMILLGSGKIKLLRELRRKDLFFSAFMGLLNPVLYYLILFKAYSVLPAQVAQPLNMIWPIVLVLISIPMLQQRIGWKSIGAMIISFSGVVLVSMQGESNEKDPENALGIALALSSSVLWALYFIFNTRDQKDPVIRMFLNFAFASAFLLAGSLLRERGLPQTFEGWATSTYVGLFEMGITFVLWLKAMQLAPSTDRISNLVYVAPFLNLVIVHLVLNEQIFLTTIYGIVLLVSGILIQQMTGTNEKARR